MTEIFFKYQEKYKRQHYTNIWFLILDLKKEIDNGNSLYFYKSIKKSFCRWKNKESGISYQIYVYDYFGYNQVPDFMIKNANYRNYMQPKHIVSWIKDNSELIDKFLKLKSFL